jgi:hypothetical protein
VEQDFFPALLPSDVQDTETAGKIQKGSMTEVGERGERDKRKKKKERWWNARMRYIY